jgi:hypothetical protein
VPSVNFSPDGRKILFCMDIKKKNTRATLVRNRDPVRFAHREQASDRRVVCQDMVSSILNLDLI